MDYQPSEKLRGTFRWITALIMYGTDTVPVLNAPGAEYVTVSDRQITYMRIIFDRAPFDAARRASG